jgi:hypothetical protein
VNKIRELLEELLEVVTAKNRRPTGDAQRLANRPLDPGATHRRAASLGVQLATCPGSYAPNFAERRAAHAFARWRPGAGATNAAPNNSNLDSLDSGAVVSRGGDVCPSRACSVPSARGRR